MAQNKVFNSQPAYISTLATLASLGGNLFNCAITSAGAAIIASAIGFAITQPYALMKHVRIQNQLTTAAVTVSLFKGASLTSAPGTQFGFSNVSIPAQSFYDWFGQARFDSTDYLTGIASSPQAVIINMDGEIGLS